MKSVCNYEYERTVQSDDHYGQDHTVSNSERTELLELVAAAEKEVFCLQYFSQAIRSHAFQSGNIPLVPNQRCSPDIMFSFKIPPGSKVRPWLTENKCNWRYDLKIIH